MFAFDEISKSINALQSQLAAEKQKNAGSPCSTHPGMSCDEAHLDDAWRIASLESSLEGMEKRNEELENKIKELSK